MIRWDGRLLGKFFVCLQQEGRLCFGGDQRSQSHKSDQLHFPSAFLYSPVLFTERRKTRNDHECCSRSFARLCGHAWIVFTPRLSGSLIRRAPKLETFRQIRIYYHMNAAFGQFAGRSMFCFIHSYYTIKTLPEWTILANVIENLAWIRETRLRLVFSETIRPDSLSV